MVNAYFLSLFSVAVVFSSGAFAQEGSPPQDPVAPVLGAMDSVAGLSESELPPEVKILQSIEKEIKDKYKKQLYLRSQVPSVFFTPSQHALLREARVGFNTRVPTLQELKDPGDPNDPNYRPPTSLRDVTLGGILFSSKNDWVVYLNNSRVTPQAIPSEVVDIKVYKDFIELRWFDPLTNQIFPIRLRPNQRFNLDTKIFLPAREL